MMAAAVMLCIEIFLILVIGTVNIVELRHRAKFRTNWSSHGGDLAIFRFFKMAAATILDFQNMEILGVGTLKTAKMRQIAASHPTHDSQEG